MGNAGNVGNEVGMRRISVGIRGIGVGIQRIRVGMRIMWGVGVGGSAGNQGGNTENLGGNVGNKGGNAENKIEKFTKFSFLFAEKKKQKKTTLELS